LRHVETLRLPTNIDDAVIGLIDPAHVTFVHRSWFWRSAKSLKLKRKQFEPVGLGFRMVRHKPSANAKGKTFIRQDLDIFRKLSTGLQSNPKQMLLGDQDTQARWYFELKKQWQLAVQDQVRFINPLKPQTLEWIT
jgi:phenylpropionate dioxygenase-like ring-hydroxylating dioxygenase large terminal subunit